MTDSHITAFGSVALDLRTSGFMLLALISDIKDIKGYIFTC